VDEPGGLQGTPAPAAGPDYPFDDESIGAPFTPTPEDRTDEDRAATFQGTPDDEPEPVAENPQARLVTEEQITRIMAAYGDLPFGSDRTTRLALFSVIVGRPVESTKDLERMESYRLLGALNDLRTGRTIATDDGHGNWEIHAGAEPPDEE